MSPRIRAIISADWHLRPDKPLARTDEDWAKTQREAMAFAVAEANKRNAPLVIIGDLCDRSKTPLWVLADFIREVSKAAFGVYILAGNHDLPYHNWDRRRDSPFDLLEAVVSMFPEDALRNLDFIDRLPCGGEEYIGWSHFGVDRVNPDAPFQFIHTLVFEKESDKPPKVTAPTAQDLLDRFDEAQWVFTGDMHRAFHYKSPIGGHVVNPGCLIRQSVDEKDYKAGVFFVDTEGEGTVQFIETPDPVELIDNSHIKTIHDREDRIEAFVDSIEIGRSLGLDFVANLTKAMSENADELGPKTIAMIDQIIAEEKEAV